MKKALAQVYQAAVCIKEEGSITEIVIKGVLSPNHPRLQIIGINDNGIFIQEITREEAVVEVKVGGQEAQEKFVAITHQQIRKRTVVMAEATEMLRQIRHVAIRNLHDEDQPIGDQVLHRVIGVQDLVLALVK